VGFWEAATEYTIKLDAKDTAGNELKYDYTVEGLFAGVLDFLRDIWDAVAGALNKAWEAVCAALDWLVNMIIEFVNRTFTSILSTLQSMVEPLLKQFIQALGMSLRHDSPVKFVGDLNNVFSYLWAPIILVSGMFSGLMAIEATVTGMSAGLGALFTQAVSNLIPTIIISTIGMFIGSVIAVSITGDNADTVFKLMGDASTACDIATSLINAISLFIIMAKTKAKYISAFSLALMGIFLSMGSAEITQSLGLPGYVTFVIDIVSLSLAVISFTDLVKNPDEKVAKFIAPICKAIGDVLSWIAIISIPLTMIDHMLSGEYSRGW